MIEREGYTTVNGVRVRTAEIKSAPKKKQIAVEEDKKPTANHKVEEGKDENEKDN